MSTRLNDLSPEIIHDLCKQRLEPFDLLTPEIRAVANDTKWGVAIDRAWDYFMDLESKTMTVSQIIDDIKKRDKLLTKSLRYRDDVLRRFGDAQKDDD